MNCLIDWGSTPPIIWNNFREKISKNGVFFFIIFQRALDLLMNEMGVDRNTLCVKKIHHRNVIALSIWQSKHTRRNVRATFECKRNRRGKKNTIPVCVDRSITHRWTHPAYKKSISQNDSRPSAPKKIRPPFKQQKTTTEKWNVDAQTKLDYRESGNSSSASRYGRGLLDCIRCGSW